eukprot:COSAG06_NODE_15035_length_1102_cov_2.006979_2_plen_185_part_00
MIEYGHAPLARSAQPDGTRAEQGSVDTGGSDWSQQISFDPADEREPLAQVLLAHAVDAAAAQVTQTAASAAAGRAEETGGEGPIVVASGPTAVFPRLCAASAAAARRAAVAGGERAESGARCSITTEDSTLSSDVAAMEDRAVMEEEEPLALPTELLWQPAAEEERRAGVRTEKHVIWPADLIV